MPLPAEINSKAGIRIIADKFHVAIDSQVTRASSKEPFRIRLSGGWFANLIELFVVPSKCKEWQGKRTCHQLAWKQEQQVCQRSKFPSTLAEVMSKEIPSFRYGKFGTLRRKSRVESQAYAADFRCWRLLLPNWNLLAGTKQWEKQAVIGLQMSNFWLQKYISSIFSFPEIHVGANCPTKTAHTYRKWNHCLQ